jgi:hypothetical protein
MLRMATSNLSQRFRTWREWISSRKHKQGILIRTIQHWKKSQFAMLRGVLAKFMSQDR